MQNCSTIADVLVTPATASKTSAADFSKSLTVSMEQVCHVVSCLLLRNMYPYRIIIDIRTHKNSFQFFSLLDDRDLDVRTVAEESINRVINALRDSHSGRLQVKARHKIARDAQN